jgi:hypothetical protein
VSRKPAEAGTTIELLVPSAAEGHLVGVAAAARTTREEPLGSPVHCT